jgi:tetratricopeptide (TPR) repeat protein
MSRNLFGCTASILLNAALVLFAVDSAAAAGRSPGLVQINRSGAVKTAARSDLERSWANCIQQKDASLAIKGCSEVINAPNTATKMLEAALTFRAVAYEHMRQPELALADCSRVMKRMPRHDVIWQACGGIELENGQPGAAVSDFTTALGLNAKNADAWLGRARAYRAQKHYPEAIADFGKVLELQPRNVFALAERAELRTELKQYAEALADLSRAAEIMPDARIFAGRAVVQRRLGKIAQAIEDYSKAISLNPKNADYYSARGALYRQQEDFDRALADFNEALKIAPQNATVLWTAASSRKPWASPMRRSQT